MADNKRATTAKATKYDEFYTRRQDIEKELGSYRKHFKNKIIFCNCDDPEWSEFWKYFHIRFKDLGLKKLVSTHYNIDGSPSYKMVYCGGNDLDISSGEKISLTSNGDFRSEECIELLKEADIVVTNPPFSLFREYIGLLIKHNKKFVIIGNMSAITYKEVFPLLRDNKIWLGNKSCGGGMDMIMPKDTFDKEKAKKYYFDEDGNIVQNIMGVIWYTNLDIVKRHEKFFKPEEEHHYYEGNEDKYPKLQNYNIIEICRVGKDGKYEGCVENIPIDYDGVMSVPVSFLDKFNKDDFKLIGMGEDNGKGYSGEESQWDGNNPHCILPNGQKMYKRIFIKNINPISKEDDLNGNN